MKEKGLLENFLFGSLDGRDGGIFFKEKFFLLKIDS